MSRLIALLAVTALAGPFSALEARPLASTAATTPPTAVSPATPDRVAEHVNKTLSENFAKADQNHDGKLTSAEAKGTMPVVEAQFDKIDIAKAGTLTLPQIEAYFAALRAEHRAKREAKTHTKSEPTAGTGANAKP